ncbi:MAG: methyltransferase domain-containing protein [Pseudomonadota bacterium]
MHLGRRSSAEDFRVIDQCARDYQDAAQRYFGRPLTALRCFEIGYGSKPMLMTWLHSQGVSISGIDLDAPMIGLDPSQIATTWRRNGLERAAKSIARELLVGNREWRTLAEAFERQHPGRDLIIPLDQMLVGDAAGSNTWSGLGPIDLIYSNDVFEHIPLDRMPSVLANMVSALAPDGVAIISPHLFTGIAGGHDVDWYPHTLDQDRRRRSEAWEHLRRDRFPANTYLNRARERDYRRLFEVDFDIIDAHRSGPELGARFLTPEIERELNAFSREELLTNQKTFVLRPKRRRV